MRHSGGRVVTAGMDRMTFNEPIHIGELLTLRASVNAVWRTSMEVGVRVEAERPAVGTVRHTNSAYLTMVAVDDEGRRVRCRRWWSRARTRSGASAPRRRAAATASPSATRSSEDVGAPPPARRAPLPCPLPRDD